MKQFENVYYFFSNVQLNPSKFFRDTFIKRTEAPIKSNDSNTPRLLVIDVENTINNFTFTFKDLVYNCSYSYKSLDPEKTVFKVTIVLSYTSRKEQAGHAFSELIRTIKVNKKSDFNMTPIIDSLSTYYSERLYGKLAFYERSMRSLITAIFIPIYKDSWAEKLEDSLGKEIKGNKKELLEGALETLDLNDLESIFFDKKLNIDVDNYDSKFEVQKVDSLPKEELVNIIKGNRPRSLWEKEISKYAIIDNAQERMKRIRELRNKIAHNKTFTDRNFNNLQKELDFIIPKLNEAEVKILSVRDTEVLKQTIKLIGEKFAELNLKLHAPYVEALEKISTSIKQVFSNEFFDIRKQLTIVNPLPDFAKAIKYTNDEIKENNTEYDE
ncbi:HEPN domain-containing protein [Lederbergia citrea]|uniref:HEPN domain-containing protein n=1 Tax=Lederbergia citrea TaxID=2833581 RepID=UPI001BC9E953|nr:HEPN domain-containing protein [Lederbergia citrea]MBS4203445.1 hypothetical protein [Lederbergia citrea]